MALSPEPVWRVKTRTCPFYQQGRCLFGDSCNFVHNAVFAQSPTPSDTICIRLEPGTPTKSPSTTIHSPRSVRSPPRSPRLSGLLLALKDVIGEGGEDDYNDSAEATYVDPNEQYVPVKVAVDNSEILLQDELPGERGSESSGSISATLPVFVPDADVNSDGSEAQVSLLSAGDSHDSEEQLFTPSAGDLPYEDESLPKSSISSALLSPVDLSQLGLNIFNQVNDDNPKAVMNNGELEDVNARESSLATSPPSPLKSTFGVLSSPFTTASSRVISPRLSAFISRQSHCSFAPQAVLDEDVPSDLSLDSPAGGGCSDTEMQPSEEYIVTEEASGVVGDSDEDVLEESDESLDNEDYMEEENSFASSSWDDQSNPTVVYLGMPPATPEEVRVAVQESRQTPTHFLSNEIDFDEDEAAANSSISEGSFDSLPGSILYDVDSFGDRTMDYTAKLAYLVSPTPINENDTLQSLYDQYSDLPETLNEPPQDRPSSSNGLLQTNILTDEPPPLSATTPFRAEFPRERVFTPPPTAIHAPSETVTAPANSSHSPVSSQSALSRSRPSSRSQSVRSAWSPDSADSELPMSVSTKVPFGFRTTATQRRASKRESSGLSIKSSVAEPLPVATSQSPTHPPDRSFHNSSVAGGLRPLRLSSILANQPFSAPPRNSIFAVNSHRQPGNLHRASISSASVSSDKSYSRNPLLLSAFPSSIPEHIRRISHSSSDDLIPSPLSSCHLGSLATFESPQSAPITRSISWLSSPPNATDSVTTSYSHSLPRSMASMHQWPEEDNQEDTAGYDHTIRYALPDVPHNASSIQRDSVTRQLMFSAATPKPTLMFAIASDNVKEVQRVLENGDADPNDLTGPQSALEFTLTNDQLKNKADIVKTLLAFGADPQAVIHRGDAPSSSPNKKLKEGTERIPSHPSLIDSMDPAIKYYIERADAPHTRRTSALIHRSFFRPLTRVRYEMIGQDWALEQLFRDLSMHSRQLSVTPIVVLLCGPSGHGKSLLARKFGSLLGVPTHTVDMPTIHDLWKSYSMSPYDPPSTRTLAEFLIDNEGKRCVVVLDEIEKTPEKSSLWPLLMPWEHDRCIFEANGRLVDVRNVVWLSTSNIGQELIFEHHNARKSPTQPMSREEYKELMGLMRPRVSERLGTSILSRVTTVLPFVPFTPEEKQAICYEALHTIAGDIIKTLPANVVDSMVAGALANHTPAEGARSLYRAVSNQLVDNI